ncbi:hypothetical protein [Acidovorax sp. SDU_ACID1]|uniref:hypothetical protein n=1 Tax=Acidovorax sp. SDU_ACID1 TaxID=3136632 RepID=UPI0038737854
MPSATALHTAHNGFATARHRVSGIPTGVAPVSPAPPATAVRCRLCTCLLGAEDDDDSALELCGSCRRRPEARRLGLPVPPAAERAAAVAKPARDFTEAERALIRKIHGFMPAQQLLALLNERLACDLGPDATPYSMEQLHTAIGGLASPAPAGGHGWAAQRKLIAQARRAGLLATVTEQLIDDFAVVFSLNPKQVLVLRDTLLQPQEDA